MQVYLVTMLELNTFIMQHCSGSAIFYVSEATTLLYKSDEEHDDTMKLVCLTIQLNILQ
jgi:hypothetical protein